MIILLLMIPQMFWGTTYAVTQFGFESWPTFALGVLRALPAGLILLALKPTWPQRRYWKPLFINAVVNIGAFFTCIFIAAQTLPAGFAAVGSATTPMFAMIINHFRGEAAPAKRQIAAALLMLTAATLLFNPAQGEVNLIGVAAMVIGILLILFGSLCAKTLIAELGWWQVLVWQLILGGLMLVPFAAWQWWQSPPSVTFSRQLFGSATWLVIANTMIAYSAFLYLLRKATILQLAFAGIANPLAGIAAGAILMSEQFEFYQYGLMALMLICALLAQLKPNQNRWKTKELSGSEAQ
ncbi:DMT family transporter [Thaumasiovibrio subtropicus]|uniref:DMT family transporter n=1 Tax=Thaumasiovibrio subtropicus TaxID=1891207 RepID=UPI00131BA51B|nr:EamA family transporter [Thaumasiovibrio subtropicus]